MATPTSFRKRTKANFLQIPGTKHSLYNSQLLISTGIPSLDNVLGGGVAVGSVLLIEEDLKATYAQLLVKHFCAEAIVTGQALSVASMDYNPQQLMQELPTPVGHSPVDTGKQIVEEWMRENDTQIVEKTMERGDQEEKLTIAWRYQNQPKFQSAPASTSFGHYYDLSKTMDTEMWKKADVSCFSSTDLEIDPTFSDTEINPCYTCLLRRLQQRIDDGKYNTSLKMEHRNILRIAIHRLGSPLWGENGGVHYRTQERDASLLRFLLALRSTLRTTFAVCLLTIPTHLFHEPEFIWRAEQLCDTVLRLESFSASDKEKNPVYKDYTGLLHLVQLPSLNELSSRMPDTLDLAFRLRRKKFTIEKLHLPPDLSVTVTAKRGDDTASSGCESTGHSKLDF